MGQALEMCVSCENKRGCDLCVDLHEWIMEHMEMENELQSYKDVRRLQKDWTSLIMTIDEMGGMPHLCELYEAEKEGRMVVLPCKVGASIFRLGVNEVLDFWQVEHADVYEDEVVIVDDSYKFFTADDIGKSVFLTRDEAEAALALKGRDG